MHKAKISVLDLARALARFDGKYEVVEVFADDISELQSDSVQAEVDDQESEIILRFDLPDGPYELVVDKTSGVARFSRSDERLGKITRKALVGGALGAAIAAATSKKGEDWLGGLILGLLAGAAVGVSADDTAARRVFALRYDIARADWQPYDGGLVPWLKESFRENRTWP